MIPSTSNRALKARKRGSYVERLLADRRERMERGPYLIGTMLIIPSCSGYFNRKANAFYKRISARWNKDRDRDEYRRDTAKPHKGKTYSPEQWLRDVRKRYYQLYPSLEEITND